MGWPARLAPSNGLPSTVVELKRSVSGTSGRRLEVATAVGLGFEALVLALGVADEADGLAGVEEDVATTGADGSAAGAR